MSLVDYNGLQTVAGLEGYTEFQSVADFLNNASANGFEVLNGGKVINATGGTAYGEIVEVTPNLTGGTQTGIRAPYFSEAESAGLTVAGAGAYMSLSVGSVLAGITAGLGLSMLSYEANKDMWIDISNNVFQNFPGYEPITYNNINEFSILALVSNDYVYVPYDIIDKVGRYLDDIGAFDYYLVPTIDVPGRYDVEYRPIDGDFIRNVLASYYQFGGSGVESLFSYADIIATGVANYTSNIDYNQVTVNVYTAGNSAIGIPYHQSIEFVFRKLLNTNIELVEHMTDIGTKVFDVATTTRMLFDTSGASDPTHPFEVLTFGLDYIIKEGKQVAELAITHGRTAIENIEIGVHGLSSQFPTIQASNILAELINGNRLFPVQPDSIIPHSPVFIPEEFPDWYRRIKEIPMINPDYEQVPDAPPLITTPWIPINVPSSPPLERPDSPPMPVSPPFPIEDPRDYPQKWVQDYPIPIDPVPPEFNTPVDRFFDPDNPPPPTTPPGTNIPTPPIIPIGGDANALFTVYNPSKSQLNAIGGVLWSSNIITEIVKMFTNNPMDAIISLHMLYATPQTGADAQIKFGYVPSGVYAPLVTNQYTSINCGNVNVPEYFGDARDYDSTTVHIYLPFIGIRDLHTQDIIGSNFSVEYTVDVYTGVVLCNLVVTRNNISKVLYTFEGNASVSLPLTGADKSRMIQSAVGFIGGMGIASMAPTAIGAMGAGLGAVKSVTGNSHMISVQRSGNFSGNAGAMGIKKPYLIINRKVGYDALNYNELYGYPSNMYIRLGNCYGYTRVKDVHVDDIDNATNEEKSEIEALLKSGVIV